MLEFSKSLAATRLFFSYSLCIENCLHSVHSGALCNTYVTSQSIRVKPDQSIALADHVTDTLMLFHQTELMMSLPI